MRFVWVFSACFDAFPVIGGPGLYIRSLGMMYSATSSKIKFDLVKGISSRTCFFNMDLVQ